MMTFTPWRSSTANRGDVWPGGEGRATTRQGRTPARVSERPSGRKRRRLAIRSARAVSPAQRSKDQPWVTQVAPGRRVKKRIAAVERIESAMAIRDFTEQIEPRT